jgi:hypothetical protein
MTSAAKKVLVVAGGLILISASIGKAKSKKAEAFATVRPNTRCLEPPQDYDYRKMKREIKKYVKKSNVFEKFTKTNNKKSIGLGIICRHWDSKNVKIRINVGVGRLTEGEGLARKTKEVLGGLVLRIIDLEDGSYFEIKAMSLPVGHRLREALDNKLVDGLPDKIRKRVAIYFGPVTLDDIGLGDLGDGIYWMQVLSRVDEESFFMPEESNYFFLIAEPKNEFERGLRRYEEIIKKEIEDKKYDATDEYEELAREFPRMIAPRYRLLEMYFYSRKRKNKKRALEIAREMEAVLPGLDDGIPYMHTDVLRILNAQRKKGKEE